MQCCKHKQDLKTATKSGVEGIGDEVGMWVGIGRVVRNTPRALHCNSYISVKKESDRRKDGTRLARTRANVVPSSLVQSSGRGDILSTRQRHPDSVCSRNLQMKFAYSQQSIGYGSLAANGAGIVREAMRGRPARRIAERQGSRELDVLSGVWGAHSEVSSLGKSHPSQLGPAVRGLDVSAPIDCSTSQNAWISVPSNQTTQCEEPTSLL